MRRIITTIAASAIGAGALVAVGCGDSGTTGGGGSGGTGGTSTVSTSSSNPTSSGANMTTTGSLASTTTSSTGMNDVCGDGVVTGTEACDDGNTTPGDGCDDSCKVENGFDCTGAPSTCTPICGDGQVVGTEGCDDGNTMAADGCDATCAVEHGYDCAGAPSTCASTCGDGLVASDEQCDDGGTATGDGCDDTCVIENGWACMNEPTVCMPTGCGDGIAVGMEKCDDGNQTPGDGCDAGCQVETGYTCSGMPSTCELSGSTCASAIVASDGFVFSGSDIGQYGDDLDFTDGSCSSVVGTPDTSSDIVFQIDLLAGQHLRATNFGDLDVVWQLVPSCMAQACLATFDGSPGMGNSEQTTGLNFTAPADGTYYVAVEDWDPASTLPTDTYELHFDVATCGDGVAELGEGCDDGNQMAGDGCSATCTPEPGYNCTGTMPSVCTPLPAANCMNPIVVTTTPFQYAGPDIKQYGDDATFNDATCSSTSSSMPHGYDIVFEKDLVVGETVTLRELGGVDALLHILTPGQCAGAPACVASTDGSEDTGISYTATAAGPVYLVVESWGSATTGDFDIRIDSSRCGDGTLNSGEGCDDGNNVDGDCCSSTCNIEAACQITGCTGTIVSGKATMLPASIPDNVPAGGVTLTINIPQTGTISNMVMGFGATHTWDSDIDVFLTGPNGGGEKDISTDNGGSGDNYTGTFFEDGSPSITGGVAPFTGFFAPETSFGTSFGGQSVTGNWTLRVADDTSGDVGKVTDWDLAFCVTP